MHARMEVLDAELVADRDAGERLAAELRACAQQEVEVQARLKARGEEVTRGEVQAQQARDRHGDAREELERLAGRLGLEPEPAERAAARRRARRPRELASNAYSGGASSSGPSTRSPSRSTPRRSSTSRSSSASARTSRRRCASSRA